MSAISIVSPLDNGNIIFINPETTDPQNVRLEIRGDKNRPDFFQWFNFKLKGDIGTHYSLTIENAKKVKYNEWNKYEPYQVYASYDGDNWFNVDTVYNEKTGHLTMDLTLKQADVQCAFFPPYDYGRHIQLIEKAKNISNCTVTSLGQTNHGRDITLLTFGMPAEHKKEIWLIARQHPGEPQAEWYAEGLIEYLAQEHPSIFEHYTFRVVPNMNPDGTFDGNLRTNGHGVDLNRMWQSPSMQDSPEVYLVFEAMKKIGVDLFVDLHSDEIIPKPFLDKAHVYCPKIHKKLEVREQQFMDLYIQLNRHMQNELNYGEADRAVPENMTFAAIAIGHYFHCPAFTLEMPTKSWSIQQCKDLAYDFFKVLAAFDPKHAHEYLTLDSAPQETVLQKVSKGIYKNVLSYVLVERPDLLNDSDLSNSIIAHGSTPSLLCMVREYLDRVQFVAHFLSIKAKWQEMEKKAETDPKYVEAAATAKNLTIKLVDEIAILLKSDDSVTATQKKTAFKDSCLQHINDAKPVLEQHRGWGGVLRAILFVLALPVTLALYAGGLFSIKTDSAQKIEKCATSLQEDVTEVGVQGPM
jgi:murein tripeptide amidase MpaA